MATPRHRRIRYIVAALAITTILMIAAFILTPTFQIAYHKHQMRRAWDQTLAEPDTHGGGLVGYTLGDTYDSYEYHRQELVRLGAIRELNYQFRHVHYPSKEASHFFGTLLLTENRPKHIDFMSPQGNEEPKPVRLTVWCYPDDAASWDAFIADRDSDEYVEKFIEGDPNPSSTVRIQKHW